MDRCQNCHDNECTHAVCDEARDWDACTAILVCEPCSEMFPSHMVEALALVPEHREVDHV